MIRSRPKGSTLFSLSVFLLIDFALIAVTINSINQSKSIYWYHYIFLLILVPMGLVVLIKVLLGYKIMNIAKGNIVVNYPVKFKKERYSIKEITQWSEETIKTASGSYQQLEIRFINNKKLTLARQEHSNYDQVIRYLSKKVAKKRI